MSLLVLMALDWSATHLVGLIETFACVEAACIAFVAFTTAR